jgi:hypothetical protein
VLEWVILSFFLEDKYLEYARLNNVSMLEIKLNEVLNLIDYPFIKKYEMPFGFEITFAYLISVIQEIYG